MRRGENEISVVSLALASSVSVWLAYAVQESWLAVLMPWMTVAVDRFEPLNRPFSFALFGVYPVAGVLIGFLVAAGVHICTRGVRVRSGRISRCALRLAALTLVLVFCGNYVMTTENWSRSVTGLYLVVGLLLAVGAVRHKQNRLIDLLSNPFVCAFLVMAIPWLRNGLSDDIWVRELATTSGWMLFLVLLSFGCQAALERLSYIRAASRPLLPVLAAVPVVLAALWAADARPLTEPGAATARAGADRPNLVLIVMDTVRADHLSVYGYDRPTTPNLEQFAKSATLYQRAVAAADLTLPSHASIFTGLYTSWHNARFGEDSKRGSRLGDEHRTLAEILRDEGYNTIGIAANHGYLQPVFNLHQGFEYFDSRGPHPLYRGIRWHLRSTISRGLCSVAPMASCYISYRTADEINAEAIEQLDELSRADQPFFLFLNYMDAHWPYRPPAPYDDTFPGRIPDFTLEDYDELRRTVLSQAGDVAPRIRKHLISQYDGAIAYEDAKLGILLSRMKELGLFDNTLIVITSDHGEAFGERGLIGHGVSVYQDQVHVPLIVKFPKTEQGRTVDTLVSHVDILPTVLGALGSKAKDDGQGRSLSGDDPDSGRTVLAESYAPAGVWDIHPRFQRIQRAMFSGTLKYVAESPGNQELFDLANDFGEQHNIVNDEPEMSNMLASQLDSLVLEARTSEPARVELAPEQIERLKALGYLK